jgi:hypothetical protein
MGTGFVSDSVPVAKDALVLMVVGINSGWKLPIAYFLIDGMTGAEKANIVSEALQKLYEVGVVVPSITCDGPASHLAMFKQLGVDLMSTPLQPSFPHPSDPVSKVHVLLDPCHMLKLLRNAWADAGIFKNSEGKSIEWRFVEELHKRQEKEGFHLANKLRSAHLHWKKQKMKVSLAAQVFSCSVADAMQFCCEKLLLPEFQGCMPTVFYLSCRQCV